MVRLENGSTAEGWFTKVDEHGYVFQVSNLTTIYETDLLQPETIRLRGLLNIHIEQFRYREYKDPNGILMNKKTWEVLRGQEEYNLSSYRTIPIYLTEEIKTYGDFHLASILKASNW